MRVALFLLHIAVLTTLFGLTPSGYAYRLGREAGALLIFTCLALWTLLRFATTRRGIVLFVALALVQVGFFGFAVFSYRSEDAALRPIWDEVAQKQKDWQAQMSQYDMQPLFEMCSGERPLSHDELLGLQERARAAQSKVSEIESESTRWAGEMESKIAKVSPASARDFRRGLEDGKRESDEIFQLSRKIYSEDEQLLGFLLAREGHYRMVKNQGLVFRSDADVTSFNDKMQGIEQLQNQLKAEMQKARELLQGTSPAH